MSTDYILSVKRKRDNKILGKSLVNSIKSILGFEKYSKMINYSEDKNRFNFTFEDLCNIKRNVWDDITNEFEKIHNNKMLIPLCSNVNIKHEIEEDIRYQKEYINELKYVYSSCANIEGIICSIASDMINDKEEMAYEYNGSDLPKEQREYANGEKYDASVYIFEDDVYCEIIAEY